MQQRLKPAARPTWTQIVAAELLCQLDVAVDEPAPTFDMCLRWEGPAALTGDFESTEGRRICHAVTCHPPSVAGFDQI